MSILLCGLTKASRRVALTTFGSGNGSGRTFRNFLALWSMSWRSRSESQGSSRRSIGTELLSSDKPARRLLDIIENGHAISQYTKDMDATAFEENALVSDAVERCLERISEAVAKLGDQAAMLLPTQPWHKIRAFGNILRHEYDDIVKDRLWEIVQNDLPSLMEASKAALRRLQDTRE